MKFRDFLAHARTLDKNVNMLLKPGTGGFLKFRLELKVHFRNTTKHYLIIALHIFRLSDKIVS